MPHSLISRWFRPEVLAMSAYHVADASHYIKLDAMENPFSWPKEIEAQWLESLQNCAMNRYPDPEARALAQQLRISNQLPDQAGILLGNGSDEIIQILLMALNSDASVLAPEPSFVMYRQIARSLGLRYHGIPLLTEDFSLDRARLMAAIAEHQPALIFLAYPNNPTGNLFDYDTLEAILQTSQGLVVIDEAYAPFTDASFMSKLNAYPNLLVMRTVSKLGLAGLRLGFLAGNPLILEELNKIRLPYNINILTQLTAKFALEHEAFLLQQTRLLRQERETVFTALNALPGIQPYPSEANFILFRSHKLSADRLFNSLKQQGILIKNLSPQGGMLDNCLRVTIGTSSENQAFLTALRNALTD